MTVKRDPAGQFNTNIIKNVIKAFGDVPGTYGTLIALGELWTYTHLGVVNSLDEDISIKFGNNEITFQANKDIILDGFKFDGTVEYKHKGSAPTAGSIQVICY